MRLLSIPILLFPGAALALVPPDYKEPTTKYLAELELGMQYNSGNTNSSNFNTRGKLVYDIENARQELVLRGYFASDNKETSAEQYQIQYQVDYKLQGTRYLFGRADLLWDRFGAFEKQHTLSSGYGFTPLDIKNTKLSLEVGAGFRYNQANLSNSATPEQNRKDEEAILRLASKFEHRLMEYTSFNADANVEYGQSNTIANLNLSYRNQLWADLALKIGMDIKYTDQVPEGTKHNDVISTVNLLYTIR
ncbi:DUF481 domain-containing protein [Ferrimonas gelatinilytica]